MMQKEDNPSEEIKNSALVTIGAKLMSFLNSKLGTLLIGTIIGILGLFTWQRQDWLFKEQFYRHQILVDRRVELIEQVNTDVGRFLASADTVVAVFAKQAPPEQIREVIETYNDQQAQWFGAHNAHTALLGFYFPINVSDKFTEIVGATERFDVKLYRLSVSDKESFSQAVNDARQVSTEIRGLIQEWNDLVLQHLQQPQSK
jgi:hypothetical protein